jgi:hypothetical protein
VFAVFMLSGCNGSQSAGDRGYYPIDSLLDFQVRYLSENKATVHKSSLMQGDKSDNDYVPADTVDWNKELEIFRTLNSINKPVNRDKYVSTDQKDTRSNLTVRSFTTREELPVKYLKIFYQETPKNIRRLEAQYEEENAMYHSTRFLTMEFEDASRNSVLIYYGISGAQKMILGDSVQYNIRAQVAIPGK